MDKKNEYSAISTIKGIISTGRLKLLFKPHLIVLDEVEKKVRINSPNEQTLLYDDVTGIDLYYFNYCVDLDIETEDNKIRLKCLDIDSAQEIKDILNYYIWEKMH